MERDERGGMSPDVIARLIVKGATEKNPPVSRIGGWKYVLLVRLAHMLPARLTSYILGKMYA